jgi:hypothetical protein
MRRGQIGFSQRVRLEWLEYAANLVLAGNTRSEVIASLQGYLRNTLSVGSQAERGNREKSITILVKTWVDVSEELVPLRDRGLRLLQRLPVDDHIFIHWCMSMAAYPFWGAVAETTGRLLRLQGSAGAAQVQRRMRELLGQRETVARAARRVLRAFVDWGVLQETQEKGLYRQAPLLTIRDEELTTWSVWAFLISTRKILEAPKSIAVHVSFRSQLKSHRSSS